MAYRYHISLRILHWLIAVLIIGLIAVGLYMGDLPSSPQKLRLIGLHKATGITVLGLVALRIALRLRFGKPQYRIPLEKALKRVAELGHLALYACMLVMPLSGWAMSSAAGYPVSFFGLFLMPPLVAPDPALKSLMSSVHEFVGYALILLIAGHAFAAIWHHFIRRDHLMGRMGFGKEAE